MKKGYCSVTANLVTDRRKTPNLPNSADRWQFNALPTVDSCPCLAVS